MATYYADKANEILSSGARIASVDTSGRTRVAYDQFTVGAGDIPNPLVSGSLVYFCGSPIPKGARILRGDMSCTVLSTGQAWIRFQYNDENGDAAIHLTRWNGQYVVAVATAQSQAYAPATASGTNAPLVGDSPVFPVAVISNADIDVAGGQISLITTYMLD